MYGYGNYYQPRNIGVPQQQMPQPMQQPVQQIPQVAPIMSQTGILGKVVDSVDVVKGTDIPLDGSTSYFPLADGTAIVTKSLQMDGTSKMVIYKPIEENKKNLPKYLTIEELDEKLKKIKQIDPDDFDELKDTIESLKKEVKGLKSKKKDE